jgi:hypothetical protein
MLSDDYEEDDGTDVSLSRDDISMDHSLGLTEEQDDDEEGFEVNEEDEEGCEEVCTANIIAV